MFKRFLIVLMLGAVSELPAKAQSTATPSSAPSALEFIGEAVKSAEGDTAINFGGQKFGAAYVPLRTFDLPGCANFSDIGVGGVFGVGTPQGLASYRLNLPQIANSVLGTSFFTKYSHGKPLPTLFLGPAVKAEWPFANWTWKHDTYLLVGIPLGSIGSAQ